jgi:hypothetical protein
MKFQGWHTKFACWRRPFIDYNKHQRPSSLKNKIAMMDCGNMTMTTIYIRCNCNLVHGWCVVQRAWYPQVNKNRTWWIRKMLQNVLPYKP